VRYPHCDPRVLHAPKTCSVCDEYPEWQKLRQTWFINFTGENVEGYTLCPAEIHRPIQIINQWHGNRAAKETK
jgi:hypothetical protein